MTISVKARFNARVIGNRKVWVILPAGGSGVRMGAGTRKQYLEVGGRRIIDHTCERFMHFPWVAGLVVVAPESDPWEPLAKPACRVDVVAGGATRFHSVRAGVEALSAAPSDWVMIHDAVRPLVSQDMCERVLEAALQVGAAIAALPLKGTIKEASPLPQAGHAQIACTRDRRYLWEAQTPQVFSYGELMACYERTQSWSLSDCEKVTDEAYLFEAMGRPVALVEGEETNIKITRPLDLQLMDAFLKRTTA